MRCRTLVSIHDVMPRTLAEVRAQLDLLQAYGVLRVTLLVVPGRDWQPEQIDQLRAWEAAGHELAGHGWCHRARHVIGLKHRVYARLVSRNCAEHLSLTASEILDLLQRNRGWFEAQGLRPPGLYVPPAWALGPLPLAEYMAAGFHQLEDLRGVHDLRAGRQTMIPVIGFEATSRLRALALKAGNGLNRVLAESVGLLRLALHPQDLQLFLHEDVERSLSRLGQCCLYRELIRDGAAPGPVQR